VLAFIGGCILIGPTTLLTVIIGLGLSLAGVLGNKFIGNRKALVRPSN
jgi:hypothetical protein